MNILEGVYRRVTRKLPGLLAARIDLLRPSLRSAWGGPLNGQYFRRTMVRDIARAVAFDRVIETGTFRGTGAEFFAAVFGTPVTTIEGSRRYYSYSERVLAYQDTVTVTFADSRAGLRELAEKDGIGEETVFFYLDAHWEDDLPLREELEIVAATWPRAVVMIDDFKVPEDPGYGFDDYGTHGRLTADYLPTHALAGWGLYYPSLSSAEETGAKRGSCVLVSPALDETCSTLASLRPSR